MYLTPISGFEHRSKIRYLSKKFANFNEFSEIKKFVQCPSVWLNLMRLTASS